VLDKEEEERD